LAWYFALKELVPLAALFGAFSLAWEALPQSLSAALLNYTPINMAL